MSGQSQTLYRKWRSQTFTDLVGQDAVTQTLQHAVAAGRLTHAYLFCGPRGTGKTSSARLLAKMVNCLNPRNGEPCNECLSCVEITEGRSTDVFEIDAASNRGIDEIRDLRERVRIMSATGRTRLYIIDEVHMLTTEAFNALLKTLEEPPPNVIFVLATTEANKLPATVVSRCQRFDFRRISMQNIISRLRYIANQEELMVDDGALELLARAAQGGMRDALSLLDQARAFCGDDLAAANVREMLGMADPALVQDIITFVATNDTAAGLHRINELTQSGIDLRQLTSQVADLWRQLMLARAGADIGPMLDLSPEDATYLKAVSANFTLDALTECARIFARSDVGTRTQVVPQLQLELSFLDCVAAVHHPAQQPVPQTAPVRPVSAPPQNVSTASPVASVVVPMPSQPAYISQPVAAQAVKVTPEPVVFTPTPPAPVEMVDTKDAIEEASASYTAGNSSLELLELITSQWQLVKRVVKSKSVQTEALLNSTVPVMVQAGNPTVVTLASEHGFHVTKLLRPESRSFIEWALQQTIQRQCHVQVLLRSEADAMLGTQMPQTANHAQTVSTHEVAAPATSLPAVSSPEPISPAQQNMTVANHVERATQPQPIPQPNSSIIPQASDDAFVRALIDQFGAEVVQVKQND